MNPDISPSSIPEQELLKRNQQLEEKVARLEKENRILRDLRRLDLIKKYGAGSESLSLEQLELLELEPGVNDAEVEAEAQREPTPAAAKKERKHPGRQELPAHLERVEQIIPCTSEQCVCGICGQEKQVIGYETSEVLDVEPAKYFVQVTKREKRACKGCEEGGVSCARAERELYKVYKMYSLSSLDLQTERRRLGMFFEVHRKQTSNSKWGVTESAK